MTAWALDECDICGGRNLETVVRLGSSPPTCNMVRVGETLAEVHYPLELLRCKDCTLVQLSMIVHPAEVFPPDYPYSSGNSAALHKNFEDLAWQATKKGVQSDDLIVDIGANDGTLLRKFYGFRTVGVEPTNQAEHIVGPAYQAPFTQAVAEDIVQEHGQAKVVTACNVMAHVDNIKEVMCGIDVLLADDGVFIAENHDLGSVVAGGQWDTIYHEHLRFYDPYTFSCLLAEMGFQTLNWHGVPTHGGSFRTMAQRGDYTQGEFPRMRDYDWDGLNAEIASARHSIRQATRTGRLWGIGATARATTIINHCGLDVDDIKCVCEVSGSDKIGHYIPGTRIPVVDEAELFEKDPPGAILFSWHLADAIVPKLREKGYKRPITVPLPTLRFLT